MSPIDDELRTALRDRATQVPTSSDPFSGVERRARGIRRRRLAAAATGGVLALAAIAVAVPTISGALDADKPAQGSFATNPTDTPSASGPASEAQRRAEADARQAQDEAGNALTGMKVVTWPYVGMNTIADGANRIDMLQKMSQALAAHWPGAEVTLEHLHPLYGAISDSDQLIVLAVGQVTGNAGAPKLVAAAWVKPTSGPATLVGLHDIEATAGQVSVFVPDGRSVGELAGGTAVVVGAPGTGQIEFREPGSTSWQPVEDAKDGRAAAFTITIPPAGQGVPQIRVLDGNGDMNHPLYEGPIGRGVTFPDI